MTSKQSKTTKKHKPTKPNDSNVKKSDAAERNKLIAQACNSPLISSSKIVYTMQGNAEIKVIDVASDMGEQVGFLNGDSIKPIEKMLMTQAYALQAIFEKASLQIARSDTVGALQAWGVLAMKAQGQCRQTLATIADIRNPKPTAFIKQQNNAITQQVNNAGEPQKEFEISANELLSEVKYEALDIRRTCAPVPVNTTMEAVAVSGCENTRR